MYEVYFKNYVQSVIDSNYIKNGESKYVKFVKDFVLVVFFFQIKIFQLVNIYGLVEKVFVELEKCFYEVKEFEGWLIVIQIVVDIFNLEQYVNFGFWVDCMNK